MATLFLVRHGETDWNRSGQIMGERPVPLNRHGVAQAQRLAEALKGRTVEALYSSPVARALQTADILSAALHVPVTVEGGLTEVGVGQWEGLYWKDLTDEIMRRNFYARPQEARPPGGETLQEVQRRAVAAVERAVAGVEGGSLLLVSHADVLRAILAHYLRIDLPTTRQMRIDHASLSALEVDGAVIDLLYLNLPPDARARG